LEGIFLENITGGVVHYMMCCLFLPQKHQDSEKHKIIAGKWMPNTYKKFDD
jgi:hypothetical protein